MQSMGSSGSYPEIERTAHREEDDDADEQSGGGFFTRLASKVRGSGSPDAAEEQLFYDSNKMVFDHKNELGAAFFRGVMEEEVWQYDYHDSFFTRARKRVDILGNRGRFQTAKKNHSEDTIARTPHGRQRVDRNDPSVRLSRDGFDFGDEVLDREHKKWIKAWVALAVGAAAFGGYVDHTFFSSHSSSKPKSSNQGLEAPAPHAAAVLDIATLDNPSEAVIQVQVSGNSTPAFLIRHAAATETF